MATIQLQLGEKRPILNSSVSGPKTVFIRAETNWPAAVGEPEPSISLDIELEIQISQGNIYRRWVTPLAAQGMKIPILSDKLVINAEYIGHGLGVPYNLYIITASLSEGPLEGNPTIYRENHKYNTLNTYPGVGLFSPIPAYATEIRMISDSYGRVNIIGNIGVTDSVEGQAYSFEELHNWKPLQLFAVQYQIVVHATGEDPFGFGFFTLEMR